MAGLVLLLGLLRVELGPSPQATIAPSGQVALRGTIVSSPELAGAAEQFVFHADSIGYGASHGIHDEAPGWEPFDGKAVVVARPSAALVQVRERPYFRYGDELLLRGWLEEARAFGDFDYPAYLERQGISHTLAFPEVEFLGEGKGHPLRAWLHDLRRGAASRLDAVLPQTQSALAQALLLGKRDALSQEIREDFRSSGTSHLLAVSGLHVGVVLFLTLGASAFAIGRRRQIYLLIPLATVWVYAALTGMAPPVERAAIMATVYLCAVAIGRPRSHLPAILLAAAVMAGLDPQALLQVSFQLSFAAVAGIALILPWARDQRPGEPHGGVWSAVYHHIRGGLIVSVAATLATLPLVAFNFPSSSYTGHTHHHPRAASHSLPAGWLCPSLGRRPSLRPPRRSHRLVHLDTADLHARIGGASGARPRLHLRRSGHTNRLGRRLLHGPSPDGDVPSLAALHRSMVP